MVAEWCFVDVGLKPKGLLCRCRVVWLTSMRRKRTSDGVLCFLMYLDSAGYSCSMTDWIGQKVLNQMEECMPGGIQL